jgi:hypothetical protein
MQDVDSYWDDERCRMHKDTGTRKFLGFDERTLRYVNHSTWNYLKPKGYRVAKIDEEGNLHNVKKVRNGELFYVRCNGLVAKINYPRISFSKKTMHELIKTNDEMLGPWYCDVPIVKEFPDPLLDYLVRMVDKAKSAVGRNVDVLTINKPVEPVPPFYDDDSDWDSMDERSLQAELDTWWD